MTENKVRPDVDPITEGHLLALGKLTLNFGALEFFVGAAVWSLLEADSLITAQTVTAELSFRGRVDLIESLARQKLADNPGLFASVQACATSARNAEQERNRIVHAHWWVGPDGRLERVKYTAKGKKGFQTQQEEVSAESLTKVAQTVSAAVQEVARTVQSLLERFPIAGGNFMIGPPVP